MQQSATLSTGSLATAQLGSRPASIADNRQLVARGEVVYFLVAVYAFVMYSRINEIASVSVGRPLYLFTIVATPAVIAVLLSGRWVKPLFSRPGTLFLIFTVWAAIGIPMSMWRGGSFETFRRYWLISLVAFVLMAGVVNTFERCRQIIWLFQWSILLDAVIAFKYAGYVNGRLDVDFGSLSNPNDLANHFLIALPFCLYFAFETPGWNSGRKWLGLLTAILVLIQVMRTGSRGGVITLFVIFAVSFLVVSGANKAKMVFGLALLMLLAIPLLPRAVLLRYQLLISDHTEVELQSAEEADQVIAAAGSSEGRKQLLQRSAAIALQHPIFGVGIGVFQVAYSKWAEQNGIHGHSAWRESHNTYTQVAAETGIPAALVFMLAVSWALRSSWKLYRRARRFSSTSQLANLAFALFLSILSFVVSSCFTQAGYSFYFPALTGLTLSLTAAAEPLLKQAEGASPAPSQTIPLPSSWAGSRPLVRR